MQYGNSLFPLSKGIVLKHSFADVFQCRFFLLETAVRSLGNRNYELFVHVFINLPHKELLRIMKFMIFLRAAVWLWFG